MTKMRLLRVCATGIGYVLLISAVRFSNFVQFIPLHNLTEKSNRTSDFINALLVTVHNIPRGIRTRKRCVKHTDWKE